MEPFRARLGQERPKRTMVRRAFQTYRGTPGAVQPESGAFQLGRTKRTVVRPGRFSLEVPAWRGRDGQGLDGRTPGTEGSKKK